MWRRLAHLLTATSLALFGGIALAAPASAGPDGPNPHSLHGQCVSAAAGQHLGWYKQANGGRNIGGNCPSGL